MFLHEGEQRQQKNCSGHREEELKAGVPLGDIGLDILDLGMVCMGGCVPLSPGGGDSC